MKAKEYITPEMFFRHIEYYACPKDFGVETEYAKENCKDGYQGDCYECWSSEIIDKRLKFEEKEDEK